MSMDATIGTQDWSRKEDPYPSRLSSEAAHYRRLDPVLYGDVREDAPLSPPYARRYERDGFLQLDDLFDEEEVVAWQEEMYRLRVELQGTGREEVITERGSGSVRSIFAIHEESEVFRRLAEDPRLVNIARYILDDDVYIHQSRVNYKPGFEGREFYWHSDFETWHVEDGLPRMRTVSFSIALSENNPYNGPVMLIPGSHMTYVSCIGETPEDHYRRSLRKQEIGVPDRGTLSDLARRRGIEAQLGPAGSVLIFDCNTLHGSGGNISPYPRSNAFFVYNAVSNRVQAPFGNTRPRPSFVASRSVRPLGG